MKNSIQHKLSFSQPPSEVWEYLTNADLMELWLMKSDFKPVVGHQFRFVINPMPQVDFDGIIHCTVLEIIPFQKLSYSWSSGNNGKVNLDSIVTWKLYARDNGTELHLDHSGFTGAEHPTMITMMDAGWLKNMHKIAELLNKKTNAGA